MSRNATNIIIKMDVRYWRRIRKWIYLILFVEFVQKRIFAVPYMSNEVYIISKSGFSVP